MGLRLVELDHDFSCYVSGEMEARFIYAEIFQDDNYDLPGLPDAPFIVDIGANIGLFSLYMKRKRPAARILAFEPAPENVSALQQNLALHGVEGVSVYPMCLGTKELDGVQLTYYPELPGNSTLYPADKRLQRSLMADRLGQKAAEGLFSATEVTVPMRRLSSILDSEFPGLPSVDLLKVDVEGAELDVLGGIDREHWQRVRNVQLEVADFGDQLRNAEELLKEQCFIVTSTPVHFMWEELRFYYVTASRSA